MTPNWPAPVQDLSRGAAAAGLGSGSRTFRHSTVFRWFGRRLCRTFRQLTASSGRRLGLACPFQTFRHSTASSTTQPGSYRTFRHSTASSATQPHPSRTFRHSTEPSGHPDRTRPDTTRPAPTIRHMTESSTEAKPKPGRARPKPDRGQAGARTQGLNSRSDDPLQPAVRVLGAAVLDVHQRLAQRRGHLAGLAGADDHVALVVVQGRDRGDHGRGAAGEHLA